MYWDQSITDQRQQVLPEVLSHQSEERQQRPTKVVVVGVAVVWVSPYLQTGETLRTDPEHIIRDPHHHCDHHRYDHHLRHRHYHHHYRYYC